MSGGRIVLDSETFKALSSDTRIGLLKKLNDQKMTLTDLANAMELSKTTVQFHLESLMSVGLIQKEDQGRKWLYYSLTKKGRDILNPDGKKINVILTLSIGLVAISILMFILYAFGGVIPWTADRPVESFLDNWQLVVGVIAIVDANILLVCARTLKRSGRRFIEVLFDEK